MKREIKAAHDTDGRAYIGVLGLLLALIAIAGITFCSACSGSNGATDQSKKKGKAPIIDGQALIVPIKLGDPSGPFSADNLRLEDARATRLSLGGSGIRDIQYDNKLKSFLLISGAPENEEKGDFILWQWDGNSGNSQPIQERVLDKRVKPEGVTSVEVGGHDFIFIVCDASRYTKIEYSDVE